MSRLASFKGPSTPTSSPVRVKQSSPSPGQPLSKSAESPYHRKVRTAMLDLRTCTSTWDDLVIIDGLRAASSLVDARTELDNELAMVPAGQQPRYHIVEPKISVMEARIEDLDTVIQKLKKQFQRMNSIIDNLESLLADAHKVRGWQWVSEEPLWTTWSLEKFVCSAEQLLVPYRRSLEMHIDIVDTLRSHSVPFETSRQAITQWAAQPHLDEDSWDAKWEDLCSVEINRWDSSG
ncbi:hypothetical protein OE88DRAFT_1674122 [Heliocybe sulcata]|uniref:Uncharacterized protein n=1 Tax=Heliocybe sulcata TaxID=5364 RepID=A0A5C3NAX2_9AGAM|nr:hypothetical protein OE88DRAFT_1674122 [Heliocybe sulcata]